MWFGRSLHGEGCKNFAAFHIKEGQIGGVDMKDIVVLHHGEGIGPTIPELDVNKGGGYAEGAVYVSDNATPEQRKLLEPFVQNHLGAEIFKKCLGVKFVKIEIKEENGIHSIKFPYGEGRQVLAVGGDGKSPMTLDNPSAYNLVVIPENFVICNTLYWNFNDYGKNLEYKDVSGCQGDFNLMGMDTTD